MGVQQVAAPFSSSPEPSRLNTEPYAQHSPKCDCQRMLRQVEGSLFVNPFYFQSFIHIIFSVMHFDIISL